MNDNIVIVKDLGLLKTIKTESVYQWSFGLILRFEGMIDLPESFSVHFANDPVLGEAKQQVGSNNQVEIPDEYLISGKYIYAWIFLHSGADDGETVYAITIPVIKRPKPSEETPDPVERGVIDQAIAALNAAVIQTGNDAAAAEEAKNQAIDISENVEEYVNRAELAASNSENYSELSISAKEEAKSYANTANTSAISASNAMTSAQASSLEAEAAKNAASSHANDAYNSANQAANFEQSAYEAAEVSNAAKEDAVTAKLAAEEAKEKAEAAAAYIEDEGFLKRTDYATSSAGGTVKVSSDRGLQMSSGTLSIKPATSLEMRNGSASGSYSPITAYHEHEATFYGLAKASGDTSQAVSSNPVGLYTPTARSKIRAMLDAVGSTDYASQSKPGVVKYSAINGIGMNSDNVLFVSGAVPSEIKSGVDMYRPIVPYRVKEAAFYGLAKAAGDTTQSRSNYSVGTYTADAIDKILQMLGVYDLIGPHEGPQASRAYSANATFLFSGSLYKATSSISVGEAIVPNVNCSKTTILELLGGN